MRGKVSDEEFVLAWQASDNKTEVAERLGISLASVGNREARLRRYGVRLTDLRSRLSKEKVERLNQLIEGTSPLPNEPEQ